MPGPTFNAPNQLDFDGETPARPDPPKVSAATAEALAQHRVPCKNGRPHDWQHSYDYGTLRSRQTFQCLCCGQVAHVKQQPVNRAALIAPPPTEKPAA